MLINQPNIRFLLLFLPLFQFFLTGCSTSVSSTQPPDSRSSTFHQHFAEQVDRFLPDSLFPPSNAGIIIYSLSRREVLYARNELLLFNPGSSQKIVTAVAALGMLSPEFQFSTEVFVDPISSAIIVRGMGDPLLTSGDIDSIAGVLAAQIDRKRSWDLMADVSWFDSTRMGKGWMWDDEPFVAPISPLCVNGNDVKVRVHPGLYPGDIATTSLEDFTGAIVVESDVTTATGGRSDSLVFIRSGGEPGTRIHVSGSIGTDRRNYSTEIGVSDPAKHWLAVFAGKLRAHGVRTGRKGVATVLPNERPLFSFHRDIDTVLHRMLKESDNLAAENLFRVMGREATGLPGGSENAIAAVEASLFGFGIDTSDIVVADGSGVSRYNLLSAHTLVEILKALYDRPAFFERFESALPIAGVDGTLSTRMRRTSAEGNLRAKTGTLRGASSLSGYVTTAGGELLAFSILMQNFPTGPRSYRATQDRLGVFLSGLRKSDID